MIVPMVRIYPQAFKPSIYDENTRLFSSSGNGFEKTMKKFLQ